MPAPTPETIHPLTETLADLTDYLRENPDPAEALARAAQEHPYMPRTTRGLYGSSPTSEQECCWCR
ncbi:hypothetical protein ELQ87_25270 [Streptomyces griseoviridis]|uniref:Uncharacterized protein n=1 Tax=Streptomyces griseoviridis TaxID=45398 RepID=A0A3Q9KY15_STRGD|nr:hypothetical protein [Streptomyces griseoviridis]AZS87187.1 hypothetical protein ELQ87_25270 [Streptomyces griseoviridis]QCN85960.1 hypothetical protein DDJ31_14005 [Streptomyces griseoviridis]